MSDFFRERLSIRNDRTGDIVGTVWGLNRKKADLDGDFIMTRQEGFRRLAKDKDLTGTDRRVLDIYFANLDFENYILISQQVIADDLEIKREQVSRSTKKLIEKGILIQGEKIGRHYCFRLNPFYGWKGKTDKEFKEFYEQYAKQTEA